MSGSCKYTDKTWVLQKKRIFVWLSNYDTSKKNFIACSTGSQFLSPSSFIAYLCCCIASNNRVIMNDGLGRPWTILWFYLSIYKKRGEQKLQLGEPVFRLRTGVLPRTKDDNKYRESVGYFMFYRLSKLELSLLSFH
jgi:hypothetical protein